MKRYVLISIKPKFANMIKTGEKTIELRRVAPKVSPGDYLVIYESSPVQRITSYCEVLNLIHETPGNLWNAVSSYACIGKSEYEKYFFGAEKAFGLRVANTIILNKPKSISDIASLKRCPQNYCYISEAEFSQLTDE